MQLNWDTKLLFHGTNVIIKEPDLKHSDEDIDFGIGFYLTQDERMAKKWASRKQNSIVNSYHIDSSNLKAYHFNLDKEWLEYVRANRVVSSDSQKIKQKYEEYDILIGPTADDSLYDTIQEYLDEEISAETAIKYLNVAGYSEQIVIKSEKAIQNLQFYQYKEIRGFDKKQARESIQEERIFVRNKLKELKKNQLEQSKKEENHGKTNITRY